MGGKGIEVPICVRFRNNFRWEDVGEHTVLCLVLKLMCTLHTNISIRIHQSYSAEIQSGGGLTYPIPLEAVLAAEIRLFP
jgi:hypothetical protein